MSQDTTKTRQETLENILKRLADASVRNVDVVKFEHALVELATHAPTTTEINMLEVDLVARQSFLRASRASAITRETDQDRKAIQASQNGGEMPTPWPADRHVEPRKPPLE